MSFHYINSNVLDNLFYILLSILMFFVLFDNVKKAKPYKKTLLAVCMSLPVILCMEFPIYIDQYCVHDFRQIPLFIGILYGGGPVGASLLLVLLGFRFGLHGFNSLTLIVYVVIFVTLTPFSNRFLRSSKKNKLIMAVFFTLTIELLTTGVALSMSDVFKVTDAYIFYFILLPPVLMFFVVYLMELLFDGINVRSNMIKLEKMEVVSQLAASISHEVRNPLTVVKGFIQLLKSSDLGEKEKEEYIEHVQRELGNAETIISEYLAFAKPATEKIEEIHVDQEIRSVVEIIKPLANMSSIKIKENICPAMVKGNKNHFRQCILNIVKNGIEAMPNGGILEIRLFEDTTYVNIEILDSGVGMKKEQINRFGEPYYSSKAKGTGLGSMVIVKTIQTMSGKLAIDSKLNEGTTMMVKIPIYRTKIDNQEKKLPSVERQSTLNK